ncbi:hypothetical protein NDN08_002054 [Rhodosorus marinus]|uniref:Uncharacterized protein n=1 Tax=Rhodosorus marinus TaxID=101924 RepID=A0AAV8UX17_9RHOD|nr:hypothetical protein NDN08_002054 [Rhodosorus marinus]
MKSLKLITLLVAVLAMAAYVEAENYENALYFMTGMQVSWIFLVHGGQDCIPLIANIGAWNSSNGFEKIGEVCVDVVEDHGTLSTRFQYSVDPGFSITRAYSGVHRNCQVKRVFPYQRSERHPGGTTNVTQFVGFDEYDCPAEYPQGCCNRRNCFSPKLKIVQDSRPELGVVNAFPADDPSGPWGCRTIRGLRRCLATISCLAE